MCKQSVYLFSLILIVGLVGSASADYFLSDDFESYSVTGSEPYEPGDLRYTWDPTGATDIYYYLETILYMHGGSQSLKLWYDNSYSPYYCGVSRTLDSPKDWTLIGTAASLSLWFRGSPNVDQMYVRLTDGSAREALVKYSDAWDPGDLLLEQWQRWNIDLQYFTNNNNDFDMTAVETLEIGIGEPVDPAPGVAGGTVYFDDIKLYQNKCAFMSGQPQADIDEDCVLDEADVNVMANEWLGGGMDSRADVDKDGKINFKDHAVLANSWLTVGAPTSECDTWPALHPEWIFCDDFETVQNLSVYYPDRSGNGMSVTTNDPFNGSYSLEQYYTTGQVSAGWITRYFGDNPHLSPPGPKYDEIYVRWYHKFEDGFTGLPPKMARLRLQYPGAWWGYMTVHQWVDPGAGFLVADTHVYVGDRWLPTAASTLDYSDPANIGRWICIEVRVKLNTPGQSDGEIEYWADGEQILLQAGVNMRDDYDAYGLNLMQWDCYWNAGSPTEQSRFYDNLVISTAPIGPVNW